MPLFSEHIANMYYGSSSPYTGLPYSYSSSVSPLGSSYSASYLNPGSNYSSHSSLSNYSRAPLSSRWLTSGARNYSPMLTTISERGSASPVRIHSPRRIPISARTYGTPNYTPRPLNINTADIDVSRDRYRHKVESPTPPKPEVPKPEVPTEPLQSRENTNIDNGPFMPRVDGKPETGIDSSPGVERSTIKRGRTVVRLYTIKRNSPRKPNEEAQTSDAPSEQEINEDTKTDGKEFMKWREKLSDDLAYKDKRAKKTLGAKLVEKFIVKDDGNEKILETPSKVEIKETETSQSLPTTPEPNTTSMENKSLDRRCSMELLAEQACLLDSLIRSENLSTATLDLSKVGITPEAKTNIEKFESSKRRKQDNMQNPLKTTKSDHSLHDSLNSYKDVRDPKNFSKRRSIRKSSSGSSLRRLDSITEFPKEQTNMDLPPIEESRLSVKQDNTKQKPKPKSKTKITSSVEVSAPMSPLKFRVENVTVEEKPRLPKKEIIYSSEVVEVSPQLSEVPEKIVDNSTETNHIKKVTNKKSICNDLESPEPEDGNFWDKIGKRETVYLVKRKQNLDEAKERNKRALFWFPEEETENSEVLAVSTEQIKQIDTDPKVTLLSSDNSKDNIVDLSNDLWIKAKTNIPEQKDKECNEVCVNNDSMDTITEVSKDNSNVLRESKVEGTKVSNECKNLGKSSSLDGFDEKKVKKPSQKKTKSEKTKKLVKKDVKSELKTLQSALPKPVTKPQEVEKPENLKFSENTNSANCNNLIQNDAPVESVHKETIAKVTKDPTNNEVEKPTIQTSENQCTEEKVEVSKILETNKTTSVTPRNLPEVVQEKEVTKSTDADINDKAVTTNTDIKSQSPLVDSLSKDTKTTGQQVTADISNNKSVVMKNDKSGPSSVEMKVNDVKPEVKTSDKDLNKSSNLVDNKGPSTSKGVCTCSNSIVPKLDETKVSNTNNNSKAQVKKSPEAKPKPGLPSKISNVVNKIVKSEDKILKDTTSLNSGGTSISSKISTDITSSIPKDVSVGTVTLPQTVDNDSSSIDHRLRDETKAIDVPDTPVELELKDIPNKDTESIVQTEEKTGEENKAENDTQKDEQPETSTQVEVNTPAIPKKPVKEEKAVRPLIATPRPLQKKAPQVIHSSDSSDSSSEESSDEEDEDESDASEDSAEFYECENNPDGRTSTGSNDSGFDSSAPTSPATFSQIKKDCDVNCHRKCEKLTANLCGVNQRLLVEALASRTASRKGGEASGTSSSAAPAHCNNTDILEQELEQSTAYDIFRKTGRFTPPARSIPRFRKYTVEDFQFIKVLGKGSFGKVLLAELRDTEYYYAVKCLKKDVVLEDDDVECTLIERKVLALGTNHPYLCHLFATFQTDSHLFFVMEYLNGGDLMFHIQQSGRFPEARARFYAAEIVSGLKFLHKRGIVYRDLKLDNILLDFEGHVRIADFGMCKLQIYLDKTADTFCGTPDYMAPEIIKGLKYNQTVDWWSFGVLLYEMLIGQSPFSGCDEDELFWSICNEMPSYPRFLSHEALTILTRLLDKDMRTRLGGTECMHGDIREQEFFHPIHWDRLERRDLETPFRPRVRHPMDTQYFDKAFTGERPRLTAVEPHVLRSMDQEPFRGFSYTNPNTTDR